jgi:hypothetical protein
VRVGTSTAYRTKQRFVEEGLERALSELPRIGAERKLDANDESLLVAMACSEPPGGRARWTMQLLAQRVPVRASTIRLKIRRASAGAKRWYSAACEWLDTLSSTTRIFSASG